MHCYRKTNEEVAQDFMETAMFILPQNDLEAVEIKKILDLIGIRYLITSQSWGANFDNLEKEIIDLIKNNGETTKYVDYFVIEISGASKIKEFINPITQTLTIIDHHKYSDDEDYSKNISSIEQVVLTILRHHVGLSAEIINHAKLIGANDSHYIDGIIEVCNKLGLNEDETEKKVIEIRALDRQAQGISREQEEFAVDAIENNIEKYDNDLIIINSPHSKCACYTDRLYRKYKNLLILSQDGESNFYGEKRIIEILQSKFDGWSGGGDNGFWGGYADQKSVKELVLFLNK